MIGPYEASKNGEINYKGNNVFPPIKNITFKSFPTEEMLQRTRALAGDSMWGHISRVNHRIHMSCNH